ncbi:MAG: Xaa-Pro peptidase family protein [Coriobacteriales bacterium]|jgi:Xaa-Pro aminopeptidase|nr:Xaa-Pro peptidase family protein [Coriobacteriales bacterium]
MNSSDYSAGRLKALRTRLGELKLDAFLTLDSAQMRWLSDWTEVFDDEQAHLALITAKKSYLHTDGRYGEALKTKDTLGRWAISTKQGGHFAFAAATLARLNKKDLRLGFESTIRLNQYRALKKAFSATGIKLVETKGMLAELRAIKDTSEIQLIRKAQSITDAAFADALTWIQPGMTELEIANRLEFVMRNKGAQALAFSSIVASGPHAALPHARPTKRRLKKGDFLILDFGASYLDYASDMTRTLVIGKATAKQHRLYEAVLAAQAAAKDGIKAGITGKQAYDLANDVFKREGLDEAFTHSLGHGAGIAVHESPTLSPQSAQPLVANMVVTVEPGVYFPGYGGVRIEDMGQVTETGFSCFTKSPRTLIEL